MIAQPCRRNCCLDDADVCLGCGRSLAEITGWHSAGDFERLQIIRRAELRLEQQQQRLRRPAATPPE